MAFARIKKTMERLLSGQKSSSRSKSATQSPSFFRSPIFRWTIRLTGTTVAVAALFSFVVVPTSRFFAQRSALAEISAEYNALADANEQLQREINQLSTPEGIRNAARAQLGYVYPGEQPLQFVDMPELPTDLPDQWPYTMVSDIVRIQSNKAATTGGSQSLIP